MSTPTNDEKACKIAIFDSFSKTVMKNVCRNIVDARKRRQKKEVLPTESMQYLFDVQYAEDQYCCPGICPQIFFRINVKHAPTGRVGTRIIAEAGPLTFWVSLFQTHFILGQINFMVSRLQRI